MNSGKRRVGDKLYEVRVEGKYIDVWAKDPLEVITKLQESKQLVGFYTISRVTNVPEYKG